MQSMHHPRTIQYGLTVNKNIQLLYNRDFIFKKLLITSQKQQQLSHHPSSMTRKNVVNDNDEWITTHIETNRIDQHNAPRTTIDTLINSITKSTIHDMPINEYYHTVMVDGWDRDR